MPKNFLSLILGAVLLSGCSEQTQGPQVFYESLVSTPARQAGIKVFSAAVQVNGNPLVTVRAQNTHTINTAFRAIIEKQINPNAAAGACPFVIALSDRAKADAMTSPVISGLLSTRDNAEPLPTGSELYCVPSDGRVAGIHRIAAAGTPAPATR